MHAITIFTTTLCCLIVTSLHTLYAICDREGQWNRKEVGSMQNNRYSLRARHTIYDGAQIDTLQKELKARSIEYCIAWSCCAAATAVTKKAS